MGGYGSGLAAITEAVAVALAPTVAVRAEVIVAVSPAWAVAVAWAGVVDEMGVGPGRSTATIPPTMSTSTIKAMPANNQARLPRRGDGGGDIGGAALYGS